ncbi:MAG TPA: hypothetical protein VKB69_14895, partial [Micromonosporaceae bacterium]|nr:hypothetical protein [Micromonosporaceae bacterium]
MTAPVMPARHSARRRSIMSRVLLAIAFLAPVSILFTQSWQDDGDKIAAARAEQRGLEYLAALQPVINAVADAQSIAVGANAVSFKVIDPAVATVNEVDERLGASLQSSVRWNTIRNAIATLHSKQLKPADAPGEFGEVTTLLMQLSDKVRQTSGLIRDPDPDTYFLEDAATHQLPASIISAGQYGDYIVLGMGSTLSQQAAANANIITAHTALLTAAANVATDVQSAVDATASRTLSTDLLEKLDKYRLSIDGLAPTAATPIAGHTSAQDNAQAAADKANVVQAANALNGAMFTALGNLLTTRIDSVSSHRWLVAGTGMVAVVIAFIPLLWLAVRRTTGRIARPSPIERGFESDRFAPLRDYTELPLRGSRFPGEDDRIPGRRGDPLPSRLAAPRQWPDVPADRDGWERTG